MESGNGKLPVTLVKRPHKMRPYRQHGSGYVTGSFEEHTVLASLEESKRLLQLLRETIDRRFRPDEAVETAIDNLEVELTMLGSNIKVLRESK